MLNFMPIVLLSSAKISLLGISLFCFYFHLLFLEILFFLPIMLKILLEVIIFCYIVELY